MRYLHYLLWPLRLVVFAALFGFAMHNANMVTLRFFLGYVWEVPLALLLLVFFVLGAIFGLLACVARMARLRREMVALRRELRGRGPASKASLIDIPRDAV